MREHIVVKYLLLCMVSAIALSGACVNQQNAIPTAVPTPSSPPMSVVEYSKACYSAYEKTLNDRRRSPTQEQMRQFIEEVRSLVPPRSLEKFHFAHLSYWETTLEGGPWLASKQWTEADAQIGQLDEETYDEFAQRELCGFDDWGN